MRARPARLPQECARLGIPGGPDTRRELREAVAKELPQHLAALLAAVRAPGIADAAEWVQPHLWESTSP